MLHKFNKEDYIQRKIYKLIILLNTISNLKLIITIKLNYLIKFNYIFSKK